MDRWNSEWKTCKNVTAQLEENGMNDGLGLVFDDG